MEMLRALPSPALTAPCKGGQGHVVISRGVTWGDSCRWQLSGVWKSRNLTQAQLCPNHVPAEVKRHFITSTEG